MLNKLSVACTCDPILVGSVEIQKKNVALRFVGRWTNACMPASTCRCRCCFCFLNRSTHVAHVVVALAITNIAQIKLLYACADECHASIHRSVRCTLSSIFGSPGKIEIELFDHYSTSTVLYVFMGELRGLLACKIEVKVKIM